MFTIEDLRQISGGDPKKLPDLVVYDPFCWQSDVRVDSKGRLHMEEAQLLLLKENVPVKRIKRIRKDAVLYRFDVAIWNLMPNLLKPATNDNERQGLKRVLTGRRAQDGAPVEVDRYAGIVAKPKVKSDEGKS